MQGTIMEFAGSLWFKKSIGMTTSGECLVNSWFIKIPTQQSMKIVVQVNGKFSIQSNNSQRETFVGQMH